MEIVDRVYVYILSMVKRYLSGENTSPFFARPTARRWTAIGMGADRQQSDSEALAIASAPPSPNFFAKLRLLKLRLYNRRFQFPYQLLLTRPGVFWIPQNISCYPIRVYFTCHFHPRFGFEF